MSTATTVPALPPFSNVAYGAPVPLGPLVDQLRTMCADSLRVVGGVLHHVVGGRLSPLDKPEALFAWMHRFSQVCWSRAGITKNEFFAALLQQLPQYAGATPHPHFPALPDVLYLAERPPARNTGALDALLNWFCPATPPDRELLKAFVLTRFWGGPPGQRPLFTFTGADTDGGRGRGVGKTTCVELLSRLVGGCHSLRPRPQNNDRLFSGLLSPTALALRIAVVDNLKAWRFSNDEFESLITAATINGHRLYHGHAERVNYLTWAVTVNGASFSKDLAQRSVVIQLARPRSSPSWYGDTVALIERHSTDILADVRWHLECSARPVTRPERWQVWAAEVVGRLADPDAVLDVIAARRADIDDDDQDADDVLEHLAACIAEAVPGVAPDAAVVQIQSTLAATWVRQLKPHLTVNQAVAELKGLQSPRLRWHRTGRGRFFTWVGERAAPDAPPRTLQYVQRSGTR